VGALIYTPASPLSCRHPLVSLWLAIPPLHLTVNCRSPFGPSCRFPCVSRRSFVSFPAAVAVFCLPTVVVVNPEVIWLPTAPARRSSLVSSPGWGRWSPPPTQNILSLFLVPVCWEHGLQLESVPENLVHRFVPSQHQLDFCVFNGLALHYGDQVSGFIPARSAVVLC
jgi:hypothetical protein